MVVDSEMMINTDFSRLKFKIRTGRWQKSEPYLFSFCCQQSMIATSILKEQAFWNVQEIHFEQFYIF